MEIMIMAEDLAKIVAIIPFKEENGGNYTKILMEKENDIIYRVKCLTALRNLTNKNSFDLEQFRKNSKGIFNRKLNIPIAMHPGLVLIPFKFREASFKDEGTNCYVNSLKIKNVRRLEKSKTEIHCTDGNIIEVLQSLDSVLFFMRMARIMKMEQFDSYRAYM